MNRGALLRLGSEAPREAPRIGSLIYTFRPAFGSAFRPAAVSHLVAVVGIAILGSNSRRRLRAGQAGSHNQDSRKHMVHVSLAGCGVRPVSIMALAAELLV